MLKRLFTSSSQIQKAFQECRVDKTHEMCHPQLLVDLAERYLATETRQNNHLNINISLANVVSKEINISINSNQKKASKREELIRLLLKKIRNENEVVRIKGLIVAHSIIKKTHDPQLIEVVLDEVDKYLVQDHSPSKEEKEIEVSLQNGRSDFIKKNIISFYCQYLKKYLMSFETVLLVTRTISTVKADPQGRVDAQYVMQLINNGFVTLNLVNYILCSQYTFNKMGRYYIDHKEILNLFVMYLNDIIVFNDYIKLVTNHSVKAIGDSNKDLLSHHFLFITQAQKTSDRLYEFFYNRYYYKEVRMLIEMPKFLTIQSDEFKRLVNHVRKQDKELVVLVKRSKYDNTGRAKSCYSKTMKTEQDSSSNLSSTCKSETLDNSMMEDVSMLQSVKEKSSRKPSIGAKRRASNVQNKRSYSEYKV